MSALGLVEDATSSPERGVCSCSGIDILSELPDTHQCMFLHVREYCTLGSSQVMGRATNPSPGMDHDGFFEIVHGF